VLKKIVVIVVIAVVIGIEHEERRGFGKGFGLNSAGVVWQGSSIVGNIAAELRRLLWWPGNLSNAPSVATTVITLPPPQRRTIKVNPVGCFI